MSNGNYISWKWVVGILVTVIGFAFSTLFYVSYNSVSKSLNTFERANERLTEEVDRLGDTLDSLKFAVSASEDLNTVQTDRIIKLLEER